MLVHAEACSRDGLSCSRAYAAEGRGQLVLARGGCWVPRRAGAVTDGGLRLLVGVFWGFMLRCGGRYEGDFGGETLGSDKVTSSHGGWTYFFRRETVIQSEPKCCGIVPREGELVEKEAVWGATFSRPKLTKAPKTSQ